MRWLRRLRNMTRAGEPEAGSYSGGSSPTEAVTLGGSGSSLVRAAFGHLTVVDGPPRLLSRRFALRDGEVSIGRTESCYVAIPDQRVSRLHAKVVRDGERLLLVNCSRTNQSFVNGAPVPDRAPLRDGDQIQLADRVVLRLEAPALRSDGTFAPGGLREAMEARVALEDRIAAEFVRDGSFLDVDVVESYQLKAAEERPERVVVSFERFRSLVEGVVEEHGGQVLNSNGDEVMAFFEGADAAVSYTHLTLPTTPYV